MIVSLQSPRVLSFAPAPTEENGQSDLMSVVKRFGSPLYTLFLPSMVRLVTLFCFCSVCRLFMKCECLDEVDQGEDRETQVLQSSWTQILSHQDAAFTFM